MRLPIEPMAPIICDELPSGEDWGYQLKWDGVRIVAELADGQVTLYSRRGLIKNNAYPELAAMLAGVPGRMVLDGEAVVFDPAKGKPNFRLVLQRERLRQPAKIRDSAAALPITYVLFDLLELDGEDLRGESCADRHERLSALFPERQERLFVTDLFYDGAALWRWVEEQGWEGVVGKRLSSPYRTGKQHRDWYKKKTAIIVQTDIVGLTWNEGRVASLVMADNGVYCGRVSLGLDEADKRWLASLPRLERSPFPALPTDLKGIRVSWLATPFAAVITALEQTDYGLLRHPKIVQLRV